MSLQPAGGMGWKYKLAILLLVAMRDNWETRIVWPDGRVDELK